MSKIWEKEPRHIEHADDATITFTIALHDPHAWEMRLEDRRRYHGINHGWATENPHDWEDTIAPVLRQFFGKSQRRPSDANDPKLAVSRRNISKVVS